MGRTTLACAAVVGLSALGCGGNSLPRVSDARPPAPPAGWIKNEYRDHGFECFVPGYTQEHKDDPTLVGAGTSYVCVTPESVYVAWVSREGEEEPVAEPDLSSHIETMKSFGHKILDSGMRARQGLRGFGISYETEDGLTIVEEIYFRGPKAYVFAVVGEDGSVRERPETKQFFDCIRFLN
ncbi:MAG: hypothetical protein AB1725_11190 [Armatimonadota bacterium]